MGESAVKGFFAGLLGPAQVPFLIIIGPFLAPIVAHQAAECAKKLHVAYPDLSDKFEDILLREFSRMDLRDEFVRVYKERTSAQIAALENAQGVGNVAAEERLVATAGQQGFDHFFALDIKRVVFEPVAGRNCEQWGIRVGLEVRLWSVSERKVVLQPLFDTYRDRTPLLPIQLSELKSLLDEPGTLRRHLVRSFEAATIYLMDKRVFELPEMSAKPRVQPNAP